MRPAYLCSLLKLGHHMVPLILFRAFRKAIGLSGFFRCGIPFAAFWTFGLFRRLDLGKRVICLPLYSIGQHPLLPEVQNAIPGTVLQPCSLFRIADDRSLLRECGFGGVLLVRLVFAGLFRSIPPGFRLSLLLALQPEAVEQGLCFVSVIGAGLFAAFLRLLILFIQFRLQHLSLFLRIHSCFTSYPLSLFYYI